MYNHTVAHGNATTAKTQTTFHGAFPKQKGFDDPNEARGLIAI